ISEVLSDLGNPSSVHAEGRRARDRVERARDGVASLVGRPRAQIVFTSGGTEGNWLGVAALAAAGERRQQPPVIATTAVRHPSLGGAVAELARRGWQVRTLDPFADDPGDGVALLAVALVNHELGTLALPALLARARARGTWIHLDAVQAAGKLELAAIPADA